MTLMTERRLTAPARLKVRGLEKVFGSTRVLKSIDLTIEDGEFIGLMGPNGAGKSTLIKILDGIYERDGGSIEVSGKSVKSLKGNPDIRVIHQDLGLIDDLAIWENLRLGRPPVTSRLGLLAETKERSMAEEALERVGLDVSIDVRVGDLSAAERTLVAVARALDAGARILVLDEATSTLPTAEASRLIEMMHTVVDSGTSVVMVTHKLSEIIDQGVRRIVVLIDGEIVADADGTSLDREGLIALLRAREIHPADDDASQPVAGEELIAFEGAQDTRCGPFDLRICRGEIVGLSGPPGSGMHDIAMLVAGRSRVRWGKVNMKADLTRALVPANREVEGGFFDLTTLDNLTISALPQWRNPLRLLSSTREREAGLGLLEELAVIPRSPDARFDALSGGNKQKVIIGRALLMSPDLFVLCEPTRGVDVSTRSQIYSLIRKTVKERQVGILVVSSDSEDLVELCDRIAVVESGRVGPFSEIGSLSGHVLEGLL